MNGGVETKKLLDYCSNNIFQVYYTDCQIHTCMTVDTCMQEKLLKMFLMPSKPMV